MIPGTRKKKLCTKKGCYPWEEFPIVDGPGTEYKVVFILGSQSMHAKVLERIERRCACNHLTLENENAGQALDFLPMGHMSSYTAHISPDELRR